MLNSIIETFKFFNLYAKENPLLTGVISLWSLGVFSYFFKDIPIKIWRTIIKFSTTTVTLTSMNDSFHNFMKWYEKKGYAQKGRYIKIKNGKYGWGTITKSLGYGIHYFWYKRRLIILNMININNLNSDDKDIITMTLIGRSHKIFDEIFNEILSEDEDKNKFKIQKFYKDNWLCSSEQRKRKLKTIFLREGVKETIINHLDSFLSREQWYLDKGIPYQTGILLYGPPGTGKTSIIKSISGYFNKPLYILNSSMLCNLDKALLELPEKSIICIEDIDTNTIVSTRKKRENEDMSIISDIDSLFKGNPSNLSDILNSIDGVQSIHGRILILTTNHKDRIDPALLRPGRIDLQIEIGYVDNFILKQFFNTFYFGFQIPSDFKIKENVSSAMVQNLILQNLYDHQKVLDELKG